MENLFNVYGILKILVYIFAIFGFFTFLQVLTHAIKDKKLGFKYIEQQEKAKELDSDIIQELIKKFPDVSEEFIRKSEKLQNIENNQEIHDINKKIRRLEEKR